MGFAARGRQGMAAAGTGGFRGMKAKHQVSAAPRAAPCKKLEQKTGSGQDRTAPYCGFGCQSCTCCQY